MRSADGFRVAFNYSKACIRFSLIGWVTNESSDGVYVSAGGQDGRVFIWNALSGGEEGVGKLEVILGAVSGKRLDLIFTFNEIKWRNMRGGLVSQGSRIFGVSK